METTVIQGSQLHPTHAFQLNSTRHRLREIWEILEVEKNQKIQCIYVYVLFQVIHIDPGGKLLTVILILAKVLAFFPRFLCS